MAILSMKRISILALRHERDALMLALQKLGHVEIDIVRDEENAHAQEDERLQSAQARVERMKQGIEFLNPYAPKKEKTIKKPMTLLPQINRPLYEEAEFQALAQSPVVDETLDKIDALQEQTSALRAKEIRQINIQNQMNLWKGLDIAVEQVKDSAYTVARMGTLGVEGADMLREEMAQLSASVEYKFTEVAEQQMGLFFVCYQADFEKLEPILKNAGFSETDFSGFVGTPVEILKNTEIELQNIHKQMAQTEKEKQSLGLHAEQLKIAQDAAIILKDRLAAMGKFAQTGKTFYLEGWVPQRDVKKVEDCVKKVSATAFVSLRDPIENEVVPTLVKNAKLVRPFEMVTDLFSTPSNTDFDPSPFIAPFYFIFFGMMLSDAGYGLILAVLCTVVARLMRRKGTGQKLVALIALGGVSAFIWGALFGSWFGIVGIRPLWIDPAKNPILMLGMTAGMGFVQIMVGIGIKMAMTIRQGKWLDAIFDQGFWMVLLLGLPMLALPETAGVGQILSIAGALGLLLTQGRHQKNIFKKFTSGLLSLYGVTAFLSDVLSYSRLFALGLGTGVIALVFNNLAQMAGPAGFLVIFVGHTFNVVISILGAFVHAARLQYLEFFGKFYEGGGHAFAPLHMETKAVDIIQ